MEWMLLPLKRYADFQGRSRRMEYWMFALGVFLFYVALWVVAAMVLGLGALGAAAAGNAGLATGGLVGMMASFGVLAVVFLIVWLALLIPSIAVAVRRLHDTDRSGFWLFLYVGPYLLGMILNAAAASSNSNGLLLAGGLIGMVGLIGGIALLVFMCLPGTVGSNRFGPDPLGGEPDLAETFR